ncbi:MAG: cold shock domain-containing protein [Candidatus Magasanikbacteria bacterium]|jgi:CspA family cold shock protein
MNGTIKSLIVDKNFGFITPEDGGKDVFFHASGLTGGVEFSQLHVGDKTSFDVEQSDKGPRAINVVLA